MNLLQKTIFLTLIVNITASCLLKQNTRNTNLCLIEENLAELEFLDELCKNGNVNKALSIIAEYKSTFESYRVLDDYCRVGHVGRLSWIKYKHVSEKLLNSKTVNMVSCQEII